MKVLSFILNAAQNTSSWQLISLLLFGVRVATYSHKPPFVTRPEVEIGFTIDNQNNVNQTKTCNRNPRW